MKTVILAGAGHAHLEILKTLNSRKTQSTQYILISPSAKSVYSGMLPRWLSGGCDLSALEIDCQALARARKVSWVTDKVVRYDPSTSRVFCLSGESYRYDVLSLNIGGDAQARASAIGTQSDSNGVSIGEWLSVRPILDFCSGWAEVLKVLVRLGSSQTVRLAVIGGGPAGVEIATGLREGLMRLDLKREPEIHLFERSDRICSGYTSAISARLLVELQKRSIQVHLRSEFQGSFDLVISTLPTHPSSIITEAADATLRIAHNIFAVGDCAQFGCELRAVPRSGVLAVHQGRYLAQAIPDVMNGVGLKPFRAPRRVLNILWLDSSSAMAIYGDGFWVGSVASRLKQWIDTEYMNSVQYSG